MCGPLLGWGEHIEGEHHYVDLRLRGDPRRADDEPVAGDDAAEATWVELHAVAELDLVEGLAELLGEHGIIATFT